LVRFLGGQSTDMPCLDRSRPKVTSNANPSNPMKPSAALEQNRPAIRAAVVRRRADNPRVFGSVLRGTDHDGSDLDILVDALPGATLFDLGGLQEDLEALLGVLVDVRTPGDLPREFRDKVLAEAVPL
jgi:predicted nucleotidyltransferase